MISGYDNGSDVEDNDDSRLPMWESESVAAVHEALEAAVTDHVRGSVTVFSTQDRRFDREFTSLDDLSSHLQELYDEIWHAYVPFDGGEAVFESDADGYVSDLLTDTGFEDFFFRIREPDNADKIITSRDLVESSAASKIIRADFNIVSAEYAEYFAKNPQKLREMDPDDFEKFMAAVFRNQGFDVEKTPASKDGGVDLILVRKSSVGSAMTLVDCKRYAATNKVGVEIVRGLYGVVEEKKATSGMIVTTSSFTKGAVEFRDKLKYRMELADLKRLRQFLAEWRR